MREPPSTNDPKESYGPSLLSLTDEDGLEHLFEVVDEGEIDDISYLAVLPYENDPQKELETDATLLIMRLAQEEEGEDSCFDIVEDEAELAKVMRMFRPRLSALYDIDEDELV